MWLHGIGWLLPRAVEVGMLCVAHLGRRHHLRFLERCEEPPISLDAGHSFRHSLFSGTPSPVTGEPCPRTIVERHHPPSGLQLWPGHSLLLQLRLPWPAHYQPRAVHWPRHWSAHLRTWHMHTCPHDQFQWRPSSWLLACPVVFKPVHVEYHPLSGHAVWTFELKER